VDLLAPKPGEKILDLGCGDGVLTKKLVDLGCDVVAVDSSVAQIEAARKLGLNAFTISGEDLLYNEEFDAVFSNAVLHWIKRADVMLAGVYRSLKPGGRFVAEMRRPRVRSQDPDCSGSSIGPPWAGWRGSGPLVFPHTRRLRHQAGTRRVSRR